MYQTDSASRTANYLFDSVEDMLGDLDRINPGRTAGFDARYYGPGGWAARFVGREFVNWSAARDASRTAWRPGLEVLERMLGDLAGAALPRPKSRKRRLRFSETDGDEVDYDRLRAGQEFWRTSRRETSNGPATITIMVDVGANCFVAHEDILWRGAAAIALTSILEEAGYRVELWAVHRSNETWPSGACKNGFWAVCLKRPGDVLDPSTLINTVSGWFFRTAYFRACYFGVSEVSESLGSARTPTTVDLDLVTPDPTRLLIADAFDYDAAVATARGLLDRLCGEN